MATSSALLFPYVDYAWLRGTSDVLVATTNYDGTSGWDVTVLERVSRDGLARISLHPPVTDDVGVVGWEALDTRDAIIVVTAIGIASEPRIELVDYDGNVLQSPVPL